MLFNKYLDGNKKRITITNKKTEKLRICTENKKEYGTLISSLDDMRKLPTLSKILGNYHYLGTV